MADALRVDIRERAEELVDVKLDLENRHGRLHFVEIARSAVDSFWDELKDEVEVHLIFLHGIRGKYILSYLTVLHDTHSLSI